MTTMGSKRKGKRALEPPRFGPRHSSPAVFFSSFSSHNLLKMTVALPRRSTPPYLPTKENYNPTHPDRFRIQFADEGEFNSCLKVVRVSSVALYALVFELEVTAGQHGQDGIWKQVGALLSFSSEGTGSEMEAGTCPLATGLRPRFHRTALGALEHTFRAALLERRHGAIPSAFSSVPALFFLILSLSKGLLAAPLLSHAFAGCIGRPARTPKHAHSV